MMGEEREQMPEEAGYPKKDRTDLPVLFTSFFLVSSNQLFLSFFDFV
jgi:hypothetical protein